VGITVLFSGSKQTWQSTSSLILSVATALLALLLQTDPFQKLCLSQFSPNLHSPQQTAFALLYNTPASWQPPSQLTILAPSQTNFAP
jgi:hypothetical protein